MAIEHNIPRYLDTPLKRRKWLDVCDKIKKQKEYVKFYEKEVKVAQGRLTQVKKELEALRRYKEDLKRTAPAKPKGRGRTKLEEGV